MDDHRKKLLALVMYFGNEIFFEENSDDESGDTDDKIYNFSAEIVPSMNETQFKIHFRLKVDVFEILLQKLHMIHRKEICVGHPEVSLDKACMLMIWYLANLESFRTVANRFGVSKSTCSSILYKMCNLLLELNTQLHIIAWPSNAEARSITAKFRSRHGMPGIIGAIDGTHIRINAPKDDHTSFINHKNYHSVLLQGVYDSDLLFIDAYVGQPGSMHDAALFKNSDLYNRIVTGNIHIPEDVYLIGDKAYPLLTYLMVPFKDNGALTRREKNYNLILSKSRCVIENAYALLKGRFRRLKYIEAVKMEHIMLLVIAGTILHKICISSGDTFEHFNLEQELQEEQNNNLVIADELRNQDNSAIIKRRAIMNNLRILI